MATKPDTRSSGISTVKMADDFGFEGHIAWAAARWPSSPAPPSRRCGPPMPDTAPPRREPEPHNRIRSCAVATPQRRAGVSSGSSSSANGHDNAPWKMLPRRHAQRLFQIDRRLGLDAQPPRRVLHQHVLNGFGQNGVQRVEHGRSQRVPHPVRVADPRSIDAGCAGRTPSTSARPLPADRRTGCWDRSSEWQ